MIDFCRGESTYLVLLQHERLEYCLCSDRKERRNMARVKKRHAGASTAPSAEHINSTFQQ